jgi:hypothetical protein
MLSQTNVHWLAINKLDLVTAHNRCLRIITLRCMYGNVSQPELNLFQFAAGRWQNRAHDLLRS